MSASQQYTRTAIGLHWIIALLIFATFGLGWFMTDIPGFSMAKLKYYSWHKWLGVTVFALAVFRVLWRFLNQPPALDASISKLQQWAAHITHWILYFLIFAVPLSGYFYSLAAGFPVVYLGLVPLPVLMQANFELVEPLKSLHQFLTYSMAILVLLHIAAALKHHVIDGDNTLTRMLPFLRKR
jgi:cytochrome b561